MYQEVYKWVKVHIVPVLIALVCLALVIILATTENPRTISIEPVAPLVGSMGINEKKVPNDITFDVTSSAGVSQSLSGEIMGSIASIIGGNVESAAAVTDLLGALADTSASKNINQFIVPTGAVVAVSYDELSVYYWTKVSKNYIPLMEHREGHVTLKLGADVVDVQLSTVGASMGIKLYHIV